MLDIQKLNLDLKCSLQFWRRFVSDIIDIKVHNLEESVSRIKQFIE